MKRIPVGGIILKCWVGSYGSVEQVLADLCTSTSLVSDKHRALTPGLEESRRQKWLTQVSVWLEVDDPALVQHITDNRDARAMFDVTNIRDWDEVAEAQQTKLLE